MPSQYSTGFRHEMIHLMHADESDSDLVLESGVAMPTLHRLEQQALIDAGLTQRTDSTGRAALRVTHKQIRTLEQELQLVKDASQIYDSLAVVDPKGCRPSR